MKKNLFWTQGLSAVVILIMVLTLFSIPVFAADNQASAAGAPFDSLLAEGRGLIPQAEPQVEEAAADGDMIRAAGAATETVAGDFVLSAKEASTPITDPIVLAAHKFVPNPMTPIPISGKSYIFQVTGFNRNLFFSATAPPVGTVVYLPLYIYWANNNTTRNFYEQNPDTGELVFNFDIDLDVKSKPEVKYFTVSYRKCTYTGVTTPTNSSGWEIDTATLWTQNFEILYNGTLTWKANGGKPSKTVYVPNGSKYAFPATPKRSGFKFDGWYTKQVGGTKLTQAKTVYLPSKEPVYVYAHWTKSVKLSLDLGGGKLSPAAKKKFANHKVTTSRKYGALPTPVARAGYKFRGWFRSTSGKAEKVTAKSYVTKSGAHKIYAQWLKKGKGKYATTAKYKQLKIGYTYAECKYILGSAHHYARPDNTAQVKVYGWFTELGDHGAALLFYNGRLYSKRWQ